MELLQGLVRAETVRPNVSCVGIAMCYSFAVKLADVIPVMLEVF